jgi:hypothetical protein
MKNVPFARPAVLALLYALAGCSNPPGELKDLAKGTMAKLTISTNAAPAPTFPFKDGAGDAHTLAEFKGKVAIAKLSTAFAGQAVAIVPISVGKGEDEGAGAAFIKRNPPLSFYTEPTYKLVYDFKPAVDEMPTTVIYDRNGVERARLQGGADWSSPEAKAVVERLLAEK